MAKITQNISNGIGNNNIVQFNTNDAADSGYAIAVLNIIIGSYEPNDSEDPTQTEFISTMQLQKTVQETIGVELALQIIYQSCIEQGLKHQFITTVPALQKGVYFLAHKKP